MKKTNYLKLIFTFAIGLAIFSACEERIPSIYTEYKPKPITADPANLVYEEVISYPVPATIVTDTPQVMVEGIYKFSLDTITASEGASFVRNKFSIDDETGVVSYDNKGGEITPGLYNVSVSLVNTPGIAIFYDVLTMEIMEVPVVATVDNANVEAGALQQGVLATVSYTDNSPDGSVTDVSYKLKSPVAGFEIDATTGAIMKTGGAAEGANLISVTLETNLGVVSFDDLVTVTVGPPPTVQYIQADGATALANVTLSPWTEYTSQPPVLSGMEASGGWTIILPEILDAASVVANADGSVTVPADQNIAVGEYIIGVTATNGSQISYDFPEQFILTVETRWSDLFTDDFNDGTTVLPSDYTNYTLSGTIDWTKAKVTKAGLPDIEGIRRIFPKDFAIETDGCLVRSVNNISGIKAIRVSFDEQFGYNDAFITKYDRMFAVGEDVTNLAAGTFVDADWNIAMAPNDDRWPGSSTWKTRIANTVSNVDVNLENVSGTEVFLMWRFTTIPGATPLNGQYLIDGVSVTASTAFTAEEE